MKKLIYTGVFSLLALGFVACSGAEDEVIDSENDTAVMDELSTEKMDELNKTIQVQEDAENLDDELKTFNESLKN